VQCPTCDRSFNGKALARHEKICVKVFQEKRKAFDVKGMRKATDASGKGVEEDYNYKPKPPRGRGSKAPAPKQEETAGAPKKIPKWKQ